MGWLRDLMLDAEIRSFGALARAALAHAQWPGESRAQPRSLAAMFSRFDRAIELEWLAERPAVQQVLAEVLRCPVGDVRAPLHRAEQEASSPARMRLEGLSAARSIEFAEEPLPPGFPPDLSVPTSWQRSLWLAKPGSGRTIAKQWLDIRGRAQIHVVRSPSALAATPTFGPPLFIDAVPSVADAVITEWVPTRPVCLAIDAPVSRIRPWIAAGWSVARSPTIEESLGSIVLWVASRLSPQAHFDAEQVTGWLREGPLAEGLIETLGDVFGWCAVVTSIGLEATRRRDKRQILTLAVRRALAPLAERRDSRSSGLIRKAPDVLIAMAERSLLLRGDWLGAQTLEGWVELLPDEDRLGPDVDWMRVHLTAASKSIRARDVERAAARFPPGAHRWMGLLRDAALLRPVDAEQFVLRPHFLARLALANAKSALIHTSSAVWGDALLGDASASVWPELLARAEAAPESLIDAVLEDLDEESASSVIALDATVVALGLRVLGGRELSPALVEPLLDEAYALALQRHDELPRPRIAFGSPIAGMQANTLWWLSLIALGETRAAKRRKADQRLMPWAQREPPTHLRQLFDDLAAQARSLPRPTPRWVLGAFAMIERLRQSIGAVMLSNSTPHVLHAPGIVLDEVLHGVLECNALEPLFDDDLLFWAFERLATERQCGEATWCASFWHAMASADFVTASRGFISRHFQRLAPHIPTEIGVAWLQGQAPIDNALGLLPLRVIQAWLDWRESGTSPIPPEVVAQMPDELVERLLIELEPTDENVLPIIWERHPERVLSRIHRFRVMMPDKAARWLEHAPLRHADVLFHGAEIDEWIKASAPVLLAIRRYAQRCIDARVPNWMLAYGWLVKVERVLRT